MKSSSTSTDAERLARENAALRAQLAQANEALQSAKRDCRDYAQRLRRASLIQQLGHVLATVPDEPGFFRHTADFLREMFPGVARVSITLQNPDERDTLRLYASDGFDELLPAGARLPLRESSASWVYRNRRLLFLRDDELSNSAMNRKLLASGVRALVMAPLIVGRECIGTLNMAARQNSAFSREEREFLSQVAEVVAQSCERWRLLENLQNALRESREQAKELARAKIRADQANAAKTTFLSSISHELRTPLNAVIGFTELIARSGHLDDAHSEYLEAINGSSAHLLSLIDDLLELSKIEAGRETLVESPCELRSLLAEVKRMLIHQARSKGLELLIHCSPRVPVFVSLDAGKLRQVLINLLNNALKFTEEGHVELQMDADDTGSTLRITVRDTGPGISDTELEALFEPFVQTRIGRMQAEGTGLGLTIVKRLLSLMGGSPIELEPVRPHGAALSFRLPVQEIPVGAASTGEGSHRRVVGLTAGIEVPRLLVADDNRLNRRLLMKLLESAGFHVRGAQDGVEALDCWQTWHPDLIWMDMQMPRLDGREATRAIRTMEGERHTIIIALTASAFEEDRSQALAAGCDGFLSKPISSFEVFDCMARWLPVRYLYDE